LGSGSSGAGGAAGTVCFTTPGGKGGSGGANGTNANQCTSGMGGNYGGGAGTVVHNLNVSSQRGGNGAVRVLWGAGRAFPSTNVTQSFANNIPTTPSVGTVTTSPSTITVPFTAAGANGGTITSHRAISTPGNVVATLNQASSGSIVYSSNTLLSNNTAYTFKVYAVNEAGAGPQSSASNSITYIV
jgi:hypothetical protein